MPGMPGKNIPEKFFLFCNIAALHCIYKVVFD